MAICYVCRKCGKSYSEQECSGDTFCKHCGSFLVKQFTVAVQSTLSQFTGHLSINHVIMAEDIKKHVSSNRAAEKLQQKSLFAKEYSIVSEPERKTAKIIEVQEGSVFETDYIRALRLKDKLAQKYKGKRLEEAIVGEVVSNTYGECYCITNTHAVSFDRISYDESKIQLISDLKLLPGIGIAREQMLKRQGYQTIEDLTRHHKWRQAAKDFLHLINLKNVFALQERLRHALPKSHPLTHYLAGFCNDEDLAILDIETLGMFGRPIILLGLADVSKDKIVTRQFLVRDISEEACALWEFTSGLKAGSALVSFNGRCFDVPFIRERLEYYGLDYEAALGIPHFDMLYFARRAFRGRFSDCRLETLEPYLGIRRSLDIPGALVPEFYDAYQRSGNVGPLFAVVEHNRQDLITLAKLFCSLYREYD